MSKDPQRSDPLRPRAPGGMGRGVMLAVVVHVLLIAALAIGVRWRASEPEGIEAELWAAAPQTAAPPPAPQPEPQKPQPEPPKPQPEPPKPPPEPPAPKVVEPPQPDPQIAIEKERKEREAKERAERERTEREKAQREKAEREKAERLAREKAEREKADRERAEKEKAEQLRRELAEQRRRAQEEKRLAELREEQLRRIQGLAGATGAPSSTGTAQHTAGPSAGYAGRIRAAVRPNITLLSSVPDNIEAEVEVRAAPDGTILGRKLVKSSGNETWDEAVLRAIDRTGALPRDIDGRVPSPMVIAFKPGQ